LSDSTTSTQYSPYDGVAGELQPTTEVAAADQPADLEHSGEKSEGWFDDCEPSKLEPTVSVEQGGCIYNYWGCIDTINIFCGDDCCLDGLG
jgi:hypothetical protein